MRLDHLLSKEKVEDCFTVQVLILKLNNEISGGDAVRGNTRLHPEHDG